MQIITLRAAPFAGPGFIDAMIVPSRGLMLLNAKLRLPSGEIVDGVVGPSPDAAAELLDGGPEDFNGNKAFSVGGAALAPYANRIRGRPLPDRREIEVEIEGSTYRLPRNWGGKAPGAEQYAMHGLILDAVADWTQPSPSRVDGVIEAGSFGGRWPGRTRLSLSWLLDAGALSLSVMAENVSDEVTPIGIGWHPYFAIPSGDRSQARLWLPARSRVEVNDYDEVLPTGRLLSTASTAYDFGARDGVALNDLYLDDCFVDLPRDDGAVVVELRDPAACVGLHISSPSHAVKAVQVYAPLDQAFAAIEPQFNLADPFGDAWPEGATGMVRLQPGEKTTYEVHVSAFALGT